MTSLSNLRAGYIGILLLATVSVDAAPMRNQLANHGSPYLAMHGHDPVKWQEWNADSVELARRQNKLLYVSSGYFSCHWCHVMQRESYQNPQIAKLLNEHFIPVKVDRELNPALDDRLIDFVERTQGYSGWPLNVFITPEGYPLVGMVYQPADNFRQILTKLNQQWQEDDKQLKGLARAAAVELTQTTQPAQAMGGHELRKLLLDQSLQLADELQGGFGDQNKFPSVPQLRALLILYQQHKNETLGRFLNRTLQVMASQGLYDHLSGGFFRYVVDPAWQVPHFEKMLYDNALLAGLYLEAAEIFQQSAYQQVAEATLQFLQHHFVMANGGLRASFSAIDEQGVEGGYYLWQAEEFKRLLNADEYQVAVEVWGLQGPPELEHGHHLHIANSVAQVAREHNLPLAQVKQRLASATRKLLDYRQQRQLPRDDKQIAAWNGLALSAFVAGAQRQQAGFQHTATDLQQFILKQLWDGQALQRATGGQRQLGKEGLEDYAYVAQGLLDYARYSQKASDLDAAAVVIRQAWKRYFASQGWQLQQDPLLKYGARQRVIADSALPSPSAVLIRVTRQLLEQQTDSELSHHLEQALQMRDTAMAESPFWYASQIMLLH